MSFDLNLNDIKVICGSLIYNRAMDMYLRNKVRAINVVMNTENSFGAESVVQSEYDINNYDVSIKIDNRNLRIYPSCTCAAFDSYHMCKHIGAVLIKLHKEGIDDKGVSFLKSSEEELLSSYKSIFEKKAKGIEKEYLSLGIKLIVDEPYYRSGKKKFYIELKIGSDRMYVVKNIKELIENVFISGGTISFGKELEYNSCCYDFYEEDKELLSVLKEIYDLNMEVSEKLYTNKSIFFSGKRVFMSEGSIRKLFDIKKGRKIEIDYMGEKYMDVELVKGNLPVSFYMFMDSDKLSIDMNGDVPKIISEEYGLYYLNNKLYLLSRDENNDFAPLLKVFDKKHDNTISFEQKEISDVANYLIPKLKEISPIVMQDESVNGVLHEEPLETSFYLDKDGDKIKCNVKFKYGSFEIDDSSYQSKCGIIRNAQEELKALEGIHRLGFSGEGLALEIKDEDAVIDFISWGVDKMRELGDVYYSDSFRDIRVITPKSFSSSVRLNDVDLLEFSFSIDGVSEEEMLDILKSIKQRKKYHKLKSGSIVPLKTGEVNNIYNLIENFDVIDKHLAKGAVQLPKYASLYLDDKIENGELDFVDRNKGFKDLIKRVKDVGGNEYVVPAQQKNVLREYQKTGFKWFKTLGDCGFGGILGDQMGLGKTVQAITYINSEKQEGRLKNKALIVCPTSLVYNWAEEFEKFSPNLSVATISGSKKEREAILEDTEHYDVLITSYALIRRDASLYDKHSFDICIIDEAQYIKNPRSLNAASVKGLKADKKFAMTGTPIENSITELWSIFDFIMPGYLKTHSRFNKDFETPIVKNKDDKVLAELLKLIRPFILRRFKDEVVKELPPKIEHKIVVDMTKEQKKLYYSFVEEYKAEINNEIKNNGLNKSKIKILSLLTRLRQICCDPASFIENYTGDSGKYLALYDILEESMENKHKVLLFSQFTTILSSIRKKLDEKGINNMYLDGSVPAKDRLDMVNKFNEGDAGVFLISLKAGGTGLNLTSADTVIHFDPWWNPAVEEQAVDRAHRIGQKNTVEVIKLIAKGTIEEKIYEIKEAKKEIIEKVIDGETREGLTISSMTEDDIRELFS